MGICNSTASKHHDIAPAEQSPTEKPSSRVEKMREDVEAAKEAMDVAYDKYMAISMCSEKEDEKFCEVQDLYRRKKEEYDGLVVEFRTAMKDCEKAKASKNLQAATEAYELAISGNLDDRIVEIRKDRYETCKQKHDYIWSPDGATKSYIASFWSAAYTYIDTIDPNIRNPWADGTRDHPIRLSAKKLKISQCTDDEKKIAAVLRVKIANYYKVAGESKKAAYGLTCDAVCCLTGATGNKNVVRVTHILPHSTTAAQMQFFCVQSVDHPRNFMLLAKNIENAFVEQRVCFLMGTDGIYLRVLESKTRKEEIYPGAGKDKTIGSFEGKSLKFNLDVDGPYTRVLSYHASCSFLVAVSKKWINRSEVKDYEDYSTRPVDRLEIASGVPKAKSLDLASPAVSGLWKSEDGEDETCRHQLLQTNSTDSMTNEQDVSVCSSHSV